MSDKRTFPTTANEPTTGFDPNAGLHRIYDQLPYSFYRLQRILKQHGMRMENIWQGYKANRRPNYHELYRIIRISDGVIIHTCISLDGLRKFFAKWDFPLEDEYSMHDASSRRNKGAQAFLDAVYSHTQSENRR